MRQFVGEHRIAYLNRNGIRYYIRIRENFYVDDPRTGKQLKAFLMFAALKSGQCRVLHRIYRINRQLCYLSASKVKDKNGIPELQLIISFNRPEIARQTYKERRQIETAFRGMKSGGFNIEDTHLTDLERIEKLFTIVMLAFAWAYVVGVYINQHLKPIRLLKHGEKAKNPFKYRLEYITTILLKPLAIIKLNVFIFFHVLRFCCYSSVFNFCQPCFNWVSSKSRWIKFKRTNG